MMWSLTTENIYNIISWENKVPMIGPAWIMHLIQIDLVKILNIAYRIHRTQKLLFDICLFHYTALFLITLYVKCYYNSILLLLCLHYKILGLIRRSFSCSGVIMSRRKLYISLVRSQILYRSPVWRPNI